MNIIYYIFTQALLLLSVLTYYYSFMNKNIKNKIKIIFYFAFLIIILFINEQYNCKKMLEIYPNFPYHIFIEIIGLLFFYIICSNFYKLYFNFNKYFYF